MGALRAMYAVAGAVPPCPAPAPCRPAQRAGAAFGLAPRPFAFTRMLPDAAYRHRRSGPCCAGPPEWTQNPQNTPQPHPLPSPELSAEAAVRVQLDALMRCDQPWAAHGIQLAYAWGLDIGGLDPSMYFGFPKDLYHEDHFRGQFANQLPELINAHSYEIEAVTQHGGDDGAPERWVVTLAVTPAGESAVQRVDFHLARKQVGSRKGSLMTAMIKKSGETES